MTSKKLIELDNVWKTYRMGKVNVHALRGLTLTVHKGEFTSVMGPSGSGKSTAMNMIGALDIPSKGTICLSGQNIAKLHESDLAQIRGRKIGFIFQKFNLIGTLTALENVALPLIFQNVPEKKRIRRAKETLQKVGLGDRINHRPSELSGGQQQRVAIARALATEPEIILADEPTGNLDSVSGRQVMNILCELHRKDKKTVVLVTHDENIAKHAQDIHFLKDGKIIKTKSSKNI